MPSSFLIEKNFADVLPPVEHASIRRDFDAAMTARACRGSEAARAVMAEVLRGLPDGGDAEIRVADSWLNDEVSRG
jgi:hypothetical protein